MMRTTGAALAALAMIGMAAPAAAGDRKPRRHHRHHDRVDAGDIVAGAVVLGALALLTGKKKRAAPRVAPTEPEAIAVAFSEDEATDACGRAAEAEGGRLAPVVHTDRIDRVDAAGDGWMMRGFVSLRDGYRATAPVTMRGFRCSIAATGTPQIRFDGEEVAGL